MAACSLLLVVVWPGSLHAADNKVDATEAAAAMERAKRQAASPMRVILEASKVRRKVPAEPEATSTETADVATRRVAGRSITPSEARVVAAPAASSVTQASAPPAAASRDEAVLPAETRQPALLTLPNVLVGDGRTVAGLPALGAGPGPTASPVRLPDAAALAPAVQAPVAQAAAVVPVASAPVKPRLIDMVEPTIPQGVLSEIGRQFEVDVDVTIRADGSVAAVNVLPSAPRQVARYVVAAMERWRFDTSSAERRHRVQLVFNDP